MSQTTDITILLDRDSVHPADDFGSHKVSMVAPSNLDINGLVIKAIERCPLPKISSGNATWIIYFGHNNECCMGVLAQQWTEPRFLVSSKTMVTDLFSTIPKELFFCYWCQSDPSNVFEALKLGTELPSKFQ